MADLRFSIVLKSEICHLTSAISPGAITNRVDGVHQIWFRDPDGYWIEVNDAKE